MDHSIPRSCRRIDVTVPLAHAKNFTDHKRVQTGASCLISTLPSELIICTIPRAGYRHFLYLSNLVNRCPHGATFTRQVIKKQEKKSRTSVRLHGCNFMGFRAAPRYLLVLYLAGRCSVIVVLFPALVINSRAVTDCRSSNCSEYLWTFRLLVLHHPWLLYVAPGERDLSEILEKGTAGRYSFCLR